MTGTGAEFVLLAACCRWPSGPSRAAAVTQAGQRRIDWARFERLVVRHRVAGLAADGLTALTTVPEDVRRRLASVAGRMAASALAMAGETLRLQRLFDEAQVPAYVVKGIPLAVLAYGNMALKEARDIDLVTTFGHLSEAEALLEAAGYRLFGKDVPLTDEELALAHAFAKHRAFRHATSGLVVELHFRLQRNPAALAAWGDDPPVQEVPLGGGTVRTLAPEALYAFLCIHGGGHAWERLKWLADLAAFVTSTPASVADLHGAACEVGAGRASAVALALCHEMLGLDVPQDILSQARRPLAARLLHKAARDALLAEREDHRRMEGIIFRRRLSRLLLIEGPAYFREEVRLLSTSELDARALRLSPRWAFLYPLVRVPRALARIARRRTAR